MNKIVKYKNIKLWTKGFGNISDPVILLIAGAHAPSVFWPDFFCHKFAQAGYFVIRYDHRDIGYSTHFPVISDLSKPIYNLSDLTDDALAILDEYRIDRTNVIGHSMGGNVAQYLAAFHPNRILKAISMSVAVELPTARHLNYDSVMQELLKNTPTGDFTKDWERGWQRSMQLLNGSQYEFDEEMAKYYVKAIYDRHHGDFNPAWNQIAAQQNKLPLLDKLPAGMLFIFGTDDIFCPAAIIQSLPAKFNIQILVGAGHMFFNKELWQQIADIIFNYLTTGKTPKS